MKEKNVDYKQQTIRLTVETHKQFKMWCVEHDVSMNIKINELIEDFLHPGEKAKVSER